MLCPYCGKKTADMPEHLKKKQRCREKHSEVLRKEFSCLYHPTKERR